MCAGQIVESDGSEEAAEAVENLLESYFMQIDGTYDRLVSICKLLFLFMLTVSSAYYSMIPRFACCCICRDLLLILFVKVM